LALALSMFEQIDSCLPGAETDLRPARNRVGTVGEQAREEVKVPMVTRLGQFSDEQCPHPPVGLLLEGIWLVQDLGRVLAKIEQDRVEVAAWRTAELQ
jgi:hypothetical protein